MANILETCMLICFGISWPISIYKGLKDKTTKGKSWFFVFIIFVGYAFGLAYKITINDITYVFYIYILNMLMITIDLAIYFHNKKLEKIEDEQ